jgi:GT2 family glycosyltransferase
VNVDLSIVLVGYNSRRHLARCLPTLESARLEVEVLVVDNGSTDDTVAWLRQTYPHVRVLEMRRNLGYGAAANRGWQAARGDIVLVMNPDTWATPGSLEELARQASLHPTALVTPKLLQRDGSINACGMIMHCTGIASCHGLGEPVGRYTGAFPVPLVSGAAIAARRAVWERLGGFDEAIFLYMEDVELSLRARLLDVPLWCAADAVLYHDYRATITPAKLRWLEANRTWVFLKLFDGRTLWRLAPAWAATALATWVFAAFRGPQYMIARTQAAYDAWLRLARVVQARRAFLPTKVVPDAVVLRDTTLRLPFAQLGLEPAHAQTLIRFTEPLYRILTGLLRPPQRTDGAAGMGGFP